MKLENHIKSLLISCSAGLISSEDLEKQVSKVNYDDFIGLLQGAYKDNDKQLFEAIIWSMPNTLTSGKKEAVLRYYLILTEHHEHENMATAFQTEFNRNLQNIPVLLRAIETIPEYLQPDDLKYPYIRKLIYAIGAQPEPDNTQALEIIMQNTDIQIVALAHHQLKKRRELGRWESQ